MMVSIGTKPDADKFHKLLLADGIATAHIAEPGKLSIRALITLRNILVKGRVDILHTHGFKADVLGYVVTRGLGIRLVSTLHGWSADENKQIRFYEAIARFFLRFYDRLYPLSPALLRDLEQRNFQSRRRRLILNGVDLSNIDFNPRRRDVNDPFSILFVGRLCRPKGIFDLLYAMAEMGDDTRTTLTIVGDGPDRRSLEELAQSIKIHNKVTFVGAVSNVLPYLACSDALVLPSYSEGIPRVVMEAFAVGVPVVGTDIPGMCELVKHETTGLLVPVRSPHAIAVALQRLREQPRLGLSMASRARSLVTEKFSAQRMARDFEREYQELIANT